MILSIHLTTGLLGWQVKIGQLVIWSSVTFKMLKTTRLERQQVSRYLSLKYLNTAVAAATTVFQH